MAWQKGPLPPDTWQWGAVVPADHAGTGFFFADFCGDHVRLLDGTPGTRRLEADQVAWYDNSIGEPPSGGRRGGVGVGGKTGDVTFIGKLGPHGSQMEDK